ncbi:MAG: HAD family hydrolase [Candidatus Cloacimonetes bacterium]|nr:HAD family hydrolase [Candidatus Cloacimonadota bacterium]
MDGTIFKTHSVIEAAIYSACHDLSLQPPSTKDIRDRLGKLEFSEYYASLFSNVPPDTLDRLIKLVTKSLETNLSTHGQLYDGVLNGLNILAQHHTLAICTNGKAHQQDKKLIAMGIDKYFTYKAPYDGTDKTARINKLKALCPLDSIMIGDMSTDIEAAKQTHILSIGVLWGYGTPKDLSNADYLVERFDQIPTIIDSI